MPDKYTLSIKKSWDEAINTPIMRFKFIAGTIIIFSIISMLPYFFGIIEKRNGPVLNDWVLARIPPHNVSVLIFIIIWGMALFILYRAIYRPYIYVVYVWALIFVIVARLISINIFTLDPPRGLIPLADPLTGIFYGQAIITKDLFFSGHISTMMLVFLCLEKRSDKIIALIAVLAIAVLLLIQHIHYTIDILAAPVITYIMYRLARWFVFSGQPV